MASNTVNIGARGRWQIVLTQVSQSQSGNYSRVRVRGILYNDGTSSAFDPSVAIRVSGEDNWLSETTFNVPGGGTDTIIDREFSVPHSDGGYKTATYQVHIGNTNTTTFGSGGSVGVSLTLDRIPKPPGKMDTPTRTFYPPAEIGVAWSQPVTNGATIDNYEVEFDNNGQTFPSPGSRFSGNGSARSLRIEDLNIDTKYWLRVRAHNRQGWGYWSDATTYTIPDVPVRPGAPTLTLNPPFAIFVDWAIPGNGGADINGYEVQRSTSSNFTSPTSVTTVSATSTTLTDLIPGTKYWIRVRARNSQGWGDWSIASSMLVVSGPRINVGGVWANSVCYVKVGGVWTVAVPYVNVGGVWTVAGG